MILSLARWRGLPMELHTPLSEPALFIFIPIHVVLITASKALLGSILGNLGGKHAALIGYSSVAPGETPCFPVQGSRREATVYFINHRYTHISRDRGCGMHFAGPKPKNFICPACGRLRMLDPAVSGPHERHNVRLVGFAVDLFGKI